MIIIVQTALGDPEDGDIIKVHELTPGEEVNFNPASAISITLQGGYDTNFTFPPAGYTTMNSLTITTDSVNVDRMII